jgi:FNIP Repeat
VISITLLTIFLHPSQLSLGHYSNHSLDHLPILLNILLFYNYEKKFNHPQDNVPPLDHLPTSLTVLQLGNDFNHPLDHLPASLTELSLGPYFNLPLDYLPASLTTLRLGKSFNHPLNHLPISLKTLKFL